MKKGWKLTLALSLVLALMLALVAGCGGGGQKWPTRPISILVGFAPGGGMDIMSRAFAEELKKKNLLGVDVTVNNMTGANGAVALEHLVKQPKDGYTLFAVSSATCTFPSTAVTKVTYKDLSMIGIPFKSIPLYSVHPDSPIKDGKDMVAALKKGGMTGSNSGMGGIWHVPQVAIADTVGGKFKAVPYQGGAPAALAAAKKEVDFGTCDVAEAQTYLKEKMLRPIWVVADQAFEVEGVGRIPPITEFIPEIKDRLTLIAGWRGLGVAKGVPQDVMNKLIDAHKKAQDSEAITKFAKQNLLLKFGSWGADADKVFEQTTQVQSWMMYDLKEGKRSPEEVGVPRPAKK